MDCQRHPGEPIAGTCDRCGNFVCRLDAEVQSSGRTICADCRAHGEVDWLQAFKMEYWGKRDGYAWLFGIGAILNSLGAFVLVMSAARSPAANLPGLALIVGVVSVVAGIQVAYFFGLRFARAAIIGVTLAAFVLGMNAGQPNPLAFLGLLVALGAYYDTRNRLFFKIDVPEEKVKKLWDRYRNNQAAQAGLMCGVVGLIVPGVAVAGLLCSLIGLARVDPTKVPPIGKKAHAIAGLICSVIGNGLWGTVLVMALLKR